MERLEAEIRRRCRLRTGLSAPKEDEHSDEEEEDEEELDDEQQNEREEDDENTDDDEAVRRRPLHYACCRHPAERAFGSRSIELVVKTHKAGIWRRLQSFTKARVYLETALQTGDVDFVKVRWCGSKVGIRLLFNFGESQI
ncbi:hypothetical protein HDU90_006949 [Geranomyces variabilis]|nr:hypothetical protein HDU90_006949 [Geranomyces variabilis]